MPRDGFAARSRERCRQIVRLLAALPETQHYRGALYVRGDQPPSAPHELPVEPLIVLTLHGDILYFALLITPPAVDGEKGEKQRSLAAWLLELAKWQMQHMPELPRKGGIHVGMPGMFYMLGVHHSQHAGAKHEVEAFAPRARCGCRRRCTEVEKIAAWRRHMKDVRGAVADSASFMAEVMPTEHARQAAAVENYFTAYAEHREVLEAAKLHDQDGFCMSVGNKASVAHGDAGNQNQFNVLFFTCPPRIAQLYAADHSYDLGVWGMEDGELFVPLAPRLHLIFNSSASHGIIPSHGLLQYSTSYTKMKSEGNAYARQCKDDALAAIRADPSLMEDFQDEQLAAWYQSSIIGTTTFQQRAVTHQLLRAAQAGEPSRVLRPQPQLEEELAEAVLSPEEAMAARQEMRRAKKVAEANMLSRLRQLQVGSRVRVSWEGGESAVGRVVEPVSILLCVRDIGVRIEYSLDQGLIVCNERLGVMTWVEVGCDRVPAPV